MVSVRSHSRRWRATSSAPRSRRASCRAPRSCRVLARVRMGDARRGRAVKRGAGQHRRSCCVCEASRTRLADARAPCLRRKASKCSAGLRRSRRIHFSTFLLPLPSIDSERLRLGTRTTLHLLPGYISTQRMQFTLVPQSTRVAFAALLSVREPTLRKRPDTSLSST